jgi:hypothetical protein
VFIGAGLAVMAVAVAVVLVATGVINPTRTVNAPVDGPVLVALVLPNEAGVLQPRVLDLYSRTATGWVVSSVSPTLPAVVSGTSGNTLADAYTFGGGSALVTASSQSGQRPASSWLVVDPAAWARLTGAKVLPFDLPAHMEVFDGRQLVPFEQGTTTVPADETALLLDGAQYLPEEQSEIVRKQVGDGLASALGKASDVGAIGLSSDLSSNRLAAWVRELGTPRRAPGD